MEVKISTGIFLNSQRGPSGTSLCIHPLPSLSGLLTANVETSKLYLGGKKKEVDCPTFLDESWGKEMLKHKRKVAEKVCEPEFPFPKSWETAWLLR